VSLAFLSGCGAWTRGGHCDQAALRAAADATDKHFADWQPATGILPDYQLAVRGLQGACELPSGYHGFLKYGVNPVPDVRSHEMDLGTPLWKDAGGMRPFRAHCPDHQRLLEEVATVAADQRAPVFYEGCKLGEIGLVTLDELSRNLGDPTGLNSHALYLWLLDDGAPPAVARALVRPILFGTDYALDDMSKLPQLPAVARGPAAAGGVPTIYVAQDGVTFGFRRVVPLTGGALASADHEGARVLELHRELAAEADQAEALASDPDRPKETLRLAIAADPGIKWETVGKLAWTAIDAGHPQIDARVVIPDPLHPLASLPLVGPGVASTTELLLSPEKIVVRCPGREGAPTLATLASELASCGGPLRLAVTDATRWQRVVEVLAEIEGKATITSLARPGAAQLDSSEPVYIAADPGTVLRITDGAVTELRTDDGGRAWHLGLSPEGVAYVLGFDRVYRIDDDALVRVTRDQAPTNGGSLVGFAPISDAEIWAYDETTVVRWDGTRWQDLSPGPVAGFAAEFDVRHQMNGILVDRVGRVWASALRSLYLREGDVWRSMDPALGLKGAEIHDMFMDADGAVHLRLSTQAFVRVVPSTPASGRDVVTRVAPPSGSAWVEGVGDRATIVGLDGKRRSYLAGRDIPGRSVGHVTGDAQGRLWAVTTAGLAVFGSGDARRIWPVGTLPGMVGSPNDILARGRGPELLPLVDAPRTGGLRAEVYLGGLPLRNAAVELCPHALLIQPRPCEGSEPTFATTTTANGSMELRDLPLAAYWISVQTPEGWKIAFQAATRLKDTGHMKEGQVVDLGSIDVTGGMVAQEMPWLKKHKPRLPK